MMNQYVHETIVWPDIISLDDLRYSSTRDPTVYNNTQLYMTMLHIKPEPNDNSTYIQDINIDNIDNDTIITSSTSSSLHTEWPDISSTIVEPIQSYSCVPKSFNHKRRMHASYEFNTMIGQIKIKNN